MREFLFPRMHHRNHDKGHMSGKRYVYHRLFQKSYSVLIVIISKSVKLLHQNNLRQMED